MARKRIIFIQTQAENAGAQEISRLLGKELEARGHDVHHLFFYRKTDAFDERANTTMVRDKRPSSALAFASFFKDLVSAIKTISPDVVFSFQHFGNVIGGPAARLAGVPWVVANQVSARETINPVLRALDMVWGVSGLYHEITVNSFDLMRDYENLPNAYTKRLVHIPHGFDLKKSSLSKSAARERFSLPQDVPLLGTVARLNEAKQIDCAIRLLSHDPTWHLVIVGQGPDEERLRDLADDLDLVERVYFLGERDPQEIGDALQAMDVFVFPSRAETFGLAAVEAGQAGIPLVVNDISVLREVLTVNGAPSAAFCDVSDTAAFAQEITRILANEDHAHGLVKSARGLKEKYALDHMVDTYEKMTMRGLETGPVAGVNDTVSP